jgi:hypothetical protein
MTDGESVLQVQSLAASIAVHRPLANPGTPKKSEGILPEALVPALAETTWTIVRDRLRRRGPQTHGSLFLGGISCDARHALPLRLRDARRTRTQEP